MKKKKESLLWRLIKWIFRGIGRGIAGLFSLIKRKIVKGNEERKLSKNPIYTARARQSQLNVVKNITGDFEGLEKRLNKDSLIMLIFGKRGSGKSSLGFRILENISYRSSRPCYVIGMGNTILPSWINRIDDIEEAHDRGVILVDEGAVSFSSRESMNASNRELGKFLAIARHKNLSVIFITQNTGMIDKNVLKLSDMLFIKEGSLLQEEMERTEMKKFYEKAKENFEGLEGDRRKYVYVIDSDFEGVISYAIPSFWTEGISKNKI